MRRSNSYRRPRFEATEIAAEFPTNSSSEISQTDPESLLDELITGFYASAIKKKLKRSTPRHSGNHPQLFVVFADPIVGSHPAEESVVFVSVLLVLRAANAGLLGFALVRDTDLPRLDPVIGKFP
jgi:hypothetical protein